MSDARETTGVPPTQGVEPPVPVREDGGDDEKPDRAVEPDQPTFPPPPPEGTETTEPVEPDEVGPPPKPEEG